MISYLSGQVADKTDKALIIDVGGVGYEVQVADYERDQAGHNTTIKLYTYHHIRETAQELFGFSTPGAKRLFEALISVSGVGPKMALAILSLGDLEAIRSSIALGDSVFIQRASGVGKRLAERIVVDLKDKVGAPATTLTTTSQLQTTVRQDDALDGLLALGYSLQQAAEALNKVDITLSPAARIKEALKTL